MRPFLTTKVIILSILQAAYMPVYAAEAVVPASSVKQANSTSAVTSSTSSTSSSSGSDDNAGVSLEAVASSIQTNVSKLKLSWGTVNDPTAKSGLVTAYTKYSENRTSCISRQKLAAYACLENLSTTILDATTAINTLLSAISASSVNNSCSTVAKVMDIAKAAMTTYTAECGVMKANCGISCSSAYSGLEAMKTALAGTAACNTGVTCDLATYTSVKKATLDLIAQEMVQNSGASIGSKKQICTEKYAALAVSAISGIASIVNSLNQAKTCDEETSATSTTDTCSISTNTALPECICAANPLLEGCSSIAATSGVTTLSTVAGTTTATSSSGLTDSDLATTSTSISQGTTSSDSSGSSSGGAAGGAGLSSSGGGGSAAAGAPTAASGKSLSTNVYSGTEGGGSGGWGSGSDSNDKNNYRSYLPGGANDPNKGLAGQSAKSVEVTSQAGKSNWEKVSDRYRDNRGSLLGN